MLLNPLLHARCSKSKRPITTDMSFPFLPYDTTWLNPSRSTEYTTYVTLNTGGVCVARVLQKYRLLLRSF